MILYSFFGGGIIDRSIHIDFALFPEYIVVVSEERLIKLCSHFAAYCGLATAAADATGECHRIISTKQERRVWAVACGNDPLGVFSCHLSSLVRSLVPFFVVGLETLWLAIRGVFI